MAQPSLFEGDYSGCTMHPENDEAIFGLRFESRPLAYVTNDGSLDLFPLFHIIEFCYAQPSLF
jgi:hypothetical protein